MRQRISGGKLDNVLLDEAVKDGIVGVMEKWG